MRHVIDGSGRRRAAIAAFAAALAYLAFGPLERARTEEVPVRAAPVGQRAACAPPCPCPCPSPCPCPPDPLVRGCAPRQCGDVYLQAGGSLLPNVGFYAGAGYVFRADACATWSVEARVGWQPWDDKTFADNDQPGAGDWTSAEVGVAYRTTPGERRHGVWRAGAMWFHAEGEPNWVDTPGDWYGGYVGFGFETDVTPDLSIGPGLTLYGGVPADGDEGFVVTPQITWGLTWWLGGSCRRAPCDCLPPGELYFDAALAASPGLGGSLGFGQVFARDARAIWSFEMAAAFHALEDDLAFAEGDGDLTQIRGGVKATFAPCACSHLVVRAGMLWFRTNADVEFLDDPGDYLGFYASLGWEWDLGRHLSTGPEVSLAFVTQEGGNVSVEFVPQAAWHLIWKL